MAEDAGQERTEQPTPKRLREAREKGQVPRSRELNTMVLLLVSAGALLLMGSQFLGGLSDIVTNGLTIQRADIFDTSALGRILLELVRHALGTFAPFLILTVLAAVLAPLALGGWTFSSESLTPKLERIDPLKGIERVFSARGLVEMLKALAKFAVVAAVAVALLWHLIGEFMGLAREPLHPALADMARLLGWSFLALSAATAVIAAIDVPFQIWYHNKQLRMTRQEVREELKDSEGRPEVRGKIRSLQREVAQRRMMAEVPKADVVVTNPTHYAVALRYDQQRMRAPRVVAKGRDLIAQQIRKVALDSGVLLVPVPPLARALYHTTELDQEIPADLYVAVAQVLAYVYQVRSVRETGGYEPPPPKDLPVPDEYR